jgi:hypothetical protein
LEEEHAQLSLYDEILATMRCHDMPGCCRDFRDTGAVKRFVILTATAKASRLAEHALSKRTEHNRYATGTYRRDTTFSKEEADASYQ